MFIIVVNINISVVGPDAVNEQVVGCYIKILSNVGEFNPSVAANPVDPRYLVAGSQYYSFHNREPNDCTVYTSSNGGASWSTPVLVPLLSEDSRCTNPVVAYAPDGS